VAVSGAEELTLVREERIRVSARMSDSLDLIRALIAHAGATADATDSQNIPQAVGPTYYKPNRLRFSVLSVEGPRRQGAVRIGQLDEAERRARPRPTTDRRYTADFFENPLVLVPQDRKRLITGASS